MQGGLDTFFTESNQRREGKRLHEPHRKRMFAQHKAYYRFLNNFTYFTEERRGRGRPRIPKKQSYSPFHPGFDPDQG